MVAPDTVLDRLRRLWDRETERPSRRLAVSLLVLAQLGAVAIGRIGTGPARLAAVCLALTALGAAVLAWWAARRRRRDPAELVRQTLAKTDPVLGSATLRALDLHERTEREHHRGSPELARLHLGRLLARASEPRLAEHAVQVSWRRSALGLTAASLCLLAVLYDPLRVVEGLNVLTARDGIAPLALRFLSHPRMVARPPAYLDQHPRTLEPGAATSVPRGTLVTILGVPRHDGRDLVLTDGAERIAFADDGRGALAARWTVRQNASLRVAARFGDVLIEQPGGWDLYAEADLPPVVRLEGAPKTVQLLEQPEVSLRYDVVDDHGLTEVSLVLRAGIREQRRSLSQLPGTTRAARGASVLRMDDEFIEQSFLPIEVTVEARDNDAFLGAKWGRSQPLVIVPPRVGERQAQRYAALRAMRDELTDLLAARLKPLAAAPARVSMTSEDEAHQEVLKRIRAALTERFGGLRFSGTVRALVRGQLERLDASWRTSREAQTEAARRRLLSANESALLAVDAMLAAVGDRDSRQAARKLSEVAAEAAAAIELSRQLDQRERADQRLNAALQVLEGGGASLRQLGSLGRDLGEIVNNGLRRVRRAWSAGDRFHARLAAEDLAARLRVPDHSFGSAGGGGVEAGGPPRFGGEGASEAAQQAAGLDQALEQLRREHAAEVGSVERALEQAMSEIDQDTLSDELQKHADAVRKAVADLPKNGAEAATARAAAAAGRAHAEAMAGAMERRDLAEAAARGQRALDTLEQAERMGRQARPGSLDSRMGQSASEAANRLAQELAWAEQGLARLRRLAAERAGQQLERSGLREGQLAERARRLHRESAQGEAPLPQSLLERLEQAADAMDDAGKRLRKLQGARGLDAQKRAQRLLELAQPEREDAGREEPAGEGDGSSLAQDTDVPGEARDPRADAFRKRVTDGLRGQVPPHLRDALQRYTEGLLR